MLSKDLCHVSPDEVGLIRDAFGMSMYEVTSYVMTTNRVELAQLLSEISHESGKE